MGWIGRLFGTQKAVNDLTDKDNGLLVRAGGWINDLSYTEAEQARDNKDVREWGLRQLAALEPFKVVQRVIAFATMGNWLFISINIVAAIWIKAIWPDIDAVTLLVKLAFSDFIIWPVALVLGFYMSGGVLPQLFGKNKGVQQQ